MGRFDQFRLPLGERIAALFRASKPSTEILSELEELLVSADVSVVLTERLLGELQKTPGGAASAHYREVLSQALLAVFAGAGAPAPLTNDREVILLVGVNGSGKTTSAAKLANHYRSLGRNVLLAAADTFRAAGSEQLVLWGGRLGIPVIEAPRGSDPGAVVYSAMKALEGSGHDLLIVDTAGRVQSKDHLLRELEKLVKIVRRFSPSQPREVLLVLDASTGQNAVVQAEKFSEFTGITGLILTKFDGTAKGGAVVSIAERMKLPVHYLGTGEGEADLFPFEAEAFVRALLGG